MCPCKRRYLVFHFYFFLLFVTWKLQGVVLLISALPAWLIGGRTTKKKTFQNTDSFHQDGFGKQIVNLILHFLTCHCVKYSTLIVFCAPKKLCLLFAFKNTVYKEQHSDFCQKHFLLSLLKHFSVFGKYHSTNQRQLLDFVSFCSFTRTTSCFFIPLLGMSPVLKKKCWQIVK